jgi:hypothetical protein
MINETGPHSAQTPVAKRERRFGARSAMLPMRSGLPAALEGRKLDRHLGNVGSGVSRVTKYRRTHYATSLYRQ